ncbi:hypothetical protein NMB32_08110 [Stenotrophomonas sp. CD2]|nr:hypothetical protein NMB32_08110 [Stenotrophomonas sp. CD2]
MSGVVGAWLPPAEDEHLLQQLAPMLRALQQRGRGRIGYWTDAEAGLALGHCRAPTDTPLQPLSSDCGRYVLCLDGRLYNRVDLQSQLRDLPRSCSDARVLLQAIVEWGVERALSRIEGAFGFSVWDRESRELWLARDPVGERPLYYGWYQGQFLFASELKALQAFAGFAPSIDQDALSLLLRHDYVPAPHTIYRGIHKLVAGAMLRIDLSDHAAGYSSQAAQGARATGAHAMRCRAHCRNRCSRRRAWSRRPTSWKLCCRRPSPHACIRRWPAVRSCPAAPIPRW